jgi:flagellar hook-associated protein 1
MAETPLPDPFSAGGGVDVIAVTAARAPLVEARLQREHPAAARERAIADQLAIVEAGLGQPGASLDAALARFYNTYAALSQNPTSSTARQQVIVEGQTLASAFNDMAVRFDTARRTADDEIRAAVTQVNALAEQLADINRQISSIDSSEAHHLLDQQSVVIDALGELVDVHVIRRENGVADVSIGNGRALVIGETEYPLTVSAGSNGLVSILTDGAAMTTDVTAEIAGGKLAGLIKVRDTLVPNYIARLDQLAYNVSTDVNGLVTSGYDLTGAAGVNFFTQPSAVTGAAMAMAVNGAVAADNRLVVTASTTAPGNNDIARAVAALQDSPMTGTSARPVDGWGSLVYAVATDGSTARQAERSHEQVAQQLEALRDQISGVSLDEEAAMLLRFQRAYEANAKFFQAVNDTLDHLLNLVRF